MNEMTSRVFAAFLFVISESERHLCATVARGDEQAAASKGAQGTLAVLNHM
jgi:hypothetical protein